jgi:hypothetical protein
MWKEKDGMDLIYMIRSASPPCRVREGGDDMHGLCMAHVPGA